MSKKTVLFIVGSGRSGSTILDLALGANDECFSVGEVQDFAVEIIENRWCTCGEKYRDCVFWGAVNKDLKFIDIFKNFNFTLKFQGKSNIRILRFINTLATFSGFGVGFPGLVNDNRALFESVFNVSERKIIVDSSKDFRRAITLYKRLGCRCKIIHLIRDVRGVSLSGKKTTYSVTLPPDYVKKTFPAKEIRSVEESTHVWRNQNNKILHSLRLFVKKADQKVVRYEDLISTPEVVLKGICDWLGVPYNDDMISFGNVLHHNVGGNPSRFNSKKILALPEKWQTALTKEEKKYCEKFGKSLLNHFDYI